MKMPGRAILTCLLVGLVAACAPALRGYNGDGIRVFVESNALEPVAITVHIDGAQHDLGLIHRYEYRSVELLPVTRNGRSHVRIAAHSPAGEPLLVDSMMVRHGAVVDLRLASPLHRSVVRRY